MNKNVLLLGRKEFVLDDVRSELSVKNVSFHSGTSLDDVRQLFNDQHVDAVIMGAGLELGLRLRIVDHIFSVSNGTTVHMKDWDSGPEGMLPFIDKILTGLMAVN